MPAGPSRRAASTALRGAGYRVKAAGEPYEGTARFVHRPTDLVVLSLEGFRARDTAFVAAVKRRSPSARILLLVPEGGRAVAVRALRAGADAYAPDPFYPDELIALAASLVADVSDGNEAVAARSVGRLAGEVAHAINNPLQILALLGESDDVPETVRGGLRDEIGRIQSVVQILGRFGLLRKPQRGREPLGPLLHRSLEKAVAGGTVRLVGPPPADGPPVSVDSSQAAAAFDSLLGFLAARATKRPLSVSARVRTTKSGLQLVEAAVRGRGLHVEPDVLDALKDAVLLNRDDTREVYPGLGLAAAVAHGHGGAFVTRPTDQGTVLAVRLPLVE